MAHNYIEGDLYKKTELKIQQIELDNVNLTDAASAVAQTLGLDNDEVLVIDARDDLLTLDILRETLDPYLIVGKQAEILAALDALPGLTVSENTQITSEGMLGWVAYDRDEGVAALDRSQDMIAQIQSRIAKRGVVFSTGPEVLSGQIEDTNKPTIINRLAQEGYQLSEGKNLNDIQDDIVCCLNDAVYNGGYGLIFTTGGVGAEDKDCSVEALLEVDPDAATPYIARFESGKGRHVKDGIRIGVGQVNDCFLFALPGPNDEVVMALEEIAPRLVAGTNKEELANAIAGALRQKLLASHHKHQHKHDHNHGHHHSH